ncbi:acyl-CoA dehydrogenase family protein [Micromonospora sp. CPCC 206060]|uniref:acyl-CoA dehydrogenase family protein n=1 Tax=Micromonospora sp. CPCC 206060 TaxID=3122406 RepID=UPI002FF0D781
MDAIISDEIRTLRDEVRGFLDEHLRPVEPALRTAGPDERRKLVAELRDLAAEHGLWGAARPVELGGRGLPWAGWAHIAEVEGSYLEGPAVLGSASLLDLTMLHRHAGPWLREQYLQPLLTGAITPCYGMTEPGVSGSDLLQMRTNARRQGDEWVINGRKWFCKVRGADFMTVFCRTGPAGASNRTAFSMILVPTDAPGFEIVRDLPLLGDTGGHAEVRLHDVRVPVSHLLGPEGGGFGMAMERLSLGRLLRALTWVGQAQRAYDLMCARLRTRRTSTDLLGDKQLMQLHVFDSYTEITSARLMLHHAAALLDADDPQVATAVSAAKVVASRMFQHVTDRAIQVYGAEGLSDDTPLSGLFREARTTRIYDGPDEVHIQAVARRLLARPEPTPPRPRTGQAPPTS